MKTKFVFFVVLVCGGTQALQQDKEGKKTFSERRNAWIRTKDAAHQREDQSNIYIHLHIIYIYI